MAKPSVKHGKKLLPLVQLGEKRKPRRESSVAAQTAATALLASRSHPVAETNKKKPVKLSSRTKRRTPRNATRLLSPPSKAIPRGAKEDARESQQQVAGKLFASLFKKYGSTQMLELLRYAKRFGSLEKARHKSIVSLLQEIDARLAQANEIERRIERAAEQERELENNLPKLHELQLLQNTLFENEISSTALREYIGQSKELVDLGFDGNTAKQVAEQIRLLSISPAELAKQFEKLTSKARADGEAVTRLEQRLLNLKTEESLLHTRIEALKKDADDNQKRILALQTYYSKQSSMLESEYEARQRAVHSRIQEERNGAEAEILALFRQRDKTREELLKLKEESDNIRKEITFAKSITTVIYDPSTVSTEQLEILAEKFAEARDNRKRKEVPTVERVVRQDPTSVMEARRTLVSLLNKSAAA